MRGEGAMSWGAERRGRFEQANEAKQEPKARTRHDGDFDEEEDLAKLGRVGASTFISRASALACMLVLASFANAADITVSGLDNSGTAWVFFEGNIVLSDATQFQQKTS